MAGAMLCSNCRGSTGGSPTNVNPTGARRCARSPAALDVGAPQMTTASRGGASSTWAASYARRRVLRSVRRGGRASRPLVLTLFSSVPPSIPPSASPVQRATIARHSAAASAWSTGPKSVHSAVQAATRAHRARSDTNARKSRRPKTKPAANACSWKVSAVARSTPLRRRPRPHALSPTSSGLAPGGGYARKRDWGDALPPRRRRRSATGWTTTAMG